MNYKSIARDVLLTEAKELELAALNLDEIALEKAVDLIVQTSGKLIITGVGKSGLVGAKIAATLLVLVHLHSFYTLLKQCMGI